MFKYLTSSYSYPFLKRGDADNMLLLLGTLLADFNKGGVFYVQEKDYSSYFGGVSESSIELIDIYFNLCFTGSPPFYALPALDFAIYKLLEPGNLTDKEVSEIFLIKQFYTYIYNSDFMGVVMIFESYCSPNVLVNFIGDLERYYNNVQSQNE